MGKWTPVSRGQRFTLVLIAAGIGAGLAAGFHPQPIDRYQADAVVAVQPAGLPDTRDVKDASRVLADAIALPQVAQAAARSLPARRLSPNEIPNRVKAVGDPSGGLIRIRARAASQRMASALAGSVAIEAVGFLRTAARMSLLDPRAPSRFNFDLDAEGWRPGSIFSLATDTFSITPSRALTFGCSGERQGCGPGVQIERTFTADTTYRARAFVRLAAGRGRLRMVLGSGSRDLVTSQAVQLRSDYVPLSASWTPKRPAGVATLALQTLDKHPAKVILDTIEVVPQRERNLDPVAETVSERLAAQLRARRAVSGDRYTTVGTAAPIANVKEHTARWALFGALAGGLVAVGGLSLAAAASRRAD